MKTKKEIVFKLFSNLRLFRPGAVQTEEQYKFVLEYIKQAVDQALEERPAGAVPAAATPAVETATPAVEAAAAEAACSRSSSCSRSSRSRSSTSRSRSSTSRSSRRSPS